MIQTNQRLENIVRVDEKEIVGLSLGELTEQRVLVGRVFLESVLAVEERERWAVALQQLFRFFGDFHRHDATPARAQENYYFSFFLRDFIHKKKLAKTLKNFKIKSKENKISHGRGNSLRNYTVKL